MTAVHIKMLEEHSATMIPFVMVFPYGLMFDRWMWSTGECQSCEWTVLSCIGQSYREEQCSRGNTCPHKPVVLWERFDKIPFIL